MNYKSLMLFLDNSLSSSRRLEFALALAARNKAHLTAVYLTYDPLVMYDPYLESKPVFIELEESKKEKQDFSKESFLIAARNAGVLCDWRTYCSSDIKYIIAYARMSDLIIMGQRNMHDVETDFGNGFHETFVLQVGRPVLLIPYAAVVPKSFEKLVVAWDGGREAARAMADAMPFLMQAQEVSVLTVNENFWHGKDFPDMKIASYLAQHSVTLEIEETEEHDATPASWLLSRAIDLDADLLVMGAYSHSRFTEFLVGGATRTVMQKMTLPVLMSH